MKFHCQSISRPFLTNEKIKVICHFLIYYLLMLIQSVVQFWIVKLRLREKNFISVIEVPAQISRLYLQYPCESLQTLPTFKQIPLWYKANGLRIDSDLGFMPMCRLHSVMLDVNLALSSVPSTTQVKKSG